MMAGMHVRRLAPADAAAFRDLRLRALGEHPTAFTSSWHEDAALPLATSEARLAAGAVCFWGAFDAGGALCGMVGLERLHRTKEQHKARVVAMYVAHEATRRGAGRALLAALIAHARAEGLADLVLTVTEGNDAARLYRAAGFQPFGIEPRAIRVEGDYLAKVHMHLQL
jgi:ribosomal protein S18 acetylase RimI-like enzyme